MALCSLLFIDLIVEIFTVCGESFCWTMNNIHDLHGHGHDSNPSEATPTKNTPKQARTFSSEAEANKNGVFWDRQIVEQDGGEKRRQDVLGEAIGSKRQKKYN